MSPSRPHIAGIATVGGTLAAVLVAALAPQPAPASMGIPEDVQFAVLQSPDGHVAFTLDPGDRRGAGGSTVTVAIDGAQTGNASLPFTFWRAEATDDGLLAGFGYTDGLDSRSRQKAGAPDGVLEGEIVAAVVDSHGTVVSER